MTKLYICFTLSISLFFTVLSIKNVFISESFYTSSVMFCILIVLSNLMPVKLPRRGSVAITFAMHLAAIFNYGPLISIVSEIISAFLIYFKESKKNKIKEIFNASQVIISIYFASLFIQPWQVAAMDMDAFLVANAFLVSVVYFIVNTILVTFVISFSEKLNPWNIWVTNFKILTPHYLALAPMGFVVAVIYYYIGPFGLIMFFLPFLLARHSFKLYMDMRDNYLNTIETLIKSIEAKDEYTKGHSERVATYSVAIGRQMSLDAADLEQLNYLALLHDIGKVAVSDSVLNKVDKLTNGEFDLVRQHPQIGADIIKDIKLLTDEKKVVLHHHERFDGYGYPDKLKGEEIPLMARIIAVADCFDAMTSNRAYRDATSYTVAIREIVECSGKQFDPKVVEAFIECFPEIFPDIKLESKKESTSAQKLLAY